MVVGGFSHWKFFGLNSFAIPPVGLAGWVWEIIEVVKSEKAISPKVNLKNLNFMIS